MVAAAELGSASLEHAATNNTGNARKASLCRVRFEMIISYFPLSLQHQSPGVRWDAAYLVNALPSCQCAPQTRQRRETACSAQIQARYGTLARTVINNHRAKVVLAGVSDTPTLDYISRLIGDQQTTEESHTQNADGKKSTTQSTRHRPLAPTANLRRADTGTGVLIYGNFHPAKLTLRPWYRQRH